jgi:uncharacterized protein (DUF924 family)/nitroreductase
MSKETPAAHELHQLIRDRWSPRAFAETPVEEERLRSLLEAARWAASGYNEQPWRFIVATRDRNEEFELLLSCLSPANQVWAGRAAVLMLTVAKKVFSHGSGAPNRHALHDVGQAIAQLTLQATASGLAVHQMGGFDGERARELYRIPEGYEPVAAVAIGYPGDPQSLPEELAGRERAPRRRRPQQCFVFQGSWGRRLVLDDERESERVLSFWFGELDEQGRADEAKAKRWWEKDATFDRQIRERFEADRHAILAGERDEWLATPRGRLAAIIVLDQMSRNMYRDTPGMFEADDEALRLALEGIERGDDLRLATDERAFLYLPLMHSEELAIQRQGVQLFTEFRDELSGELRERISRNLDFAIRHQEIIERFGRFPHRNAILGRASTPEELAFLEQPGSSF